MELFGIIDVPVWILLIVLLFALFYTYSTANFKKFERLGVKGPKPILGLGNLMEIMKKGYVEALTEWYQKYGRVFGFHEGRHPVLVVGDLDMLRDITIKEFGSFTNRRDFGVRKHAHPPHTEFLTLAADDDWRHKRNTQSPTFSSGKLKKMLYLINKACESMVQAMREKAENHEPFEAKRYTGGYTMEVIASTAFGMDIDIQSNPDHLFVKHARKFFEFSIFDPLFLAILTFPFVINIFGLLKLPTLPKEATEFFTAIVRRALEDRRKDPGKHHDFLELMVNAAREAETAGETQKTNNKTESTDGHLFWVDKRKGQGMTEMEIVGASILFFIAGYHTTSATLAHALYHLATNLECQDRLIAEIDAHFPDGKQPTYESIAELPYLEMVLFETLRLTPPAAMVDRVCSRDTEIRGLKIPAGTTVAIPIYLIHHDPELWPDPETFDPDRFSPEKRQLHHPLQWIPFGYGPRNCIGMRLALVQAKLALIQLMQNFRFVPNEKTAPLRFGTTFLLTTTKDGVWVTAENRK